MRIPRGAGLRVDVCTLRAGGSFLVRGLVVARGDRFVPVSGSVRVGSALTLASLLLPLPEGELVSLAVRPDDTVYREGDAAALVRVWQGSVAAGAELGVVCAGFPALEGSCWFSEAGVGRPEPLSLQPCAMVGADPAAGAEWSLALGLAVCAEVLAVRWQLVASVAAANRYGGLRVTLQSGLVLDQYVVSAVTASQTVVVEFLAEGVDAHSMVNLRSIGCGRLGLSSGMSIGSITNGLQAGDQISSPEVLGRWYPALWLAFA